MLDYYSTLTYECLQWLSTCFSLLDFNYDSEYHYLPELQYQSEESNHTSGACAAIEESMFTFVVMFAYLLLWIIYVNLMIVYVDFDCKRKFAIIEFEKPVYCAEKSLVIGSRLDTDAYILLVFLCFVL